MKLIGPRTKKRLPSVSTVFAWFVFLILDGPDAAKRVMSNLPELLSSPDGLWTMLMLLVLSAVLWLTREKGDEDEEVDLSGEETVFKQLHAQVVRWDEEDTDEATRKAAVSGLREYAKGMLPPARFRIVDRLLSNPGVSARQRTSSAALHIAGVIQKHTLEKMRTLKKARESGDRGILEFVQQHGLVPSGDKARFQKTLESMERATPPEPKQTPEPDEGTSN